MQSATFDPNSDVRFVKVNLVFGLTAVSKSTSGSKYTMRIVFVFLSLFLFLFSCSFSSSCVDVCFVHAYYDVTRMSA